MGTVSSTDVYWPVDEHRQMKTTNVKKLVVIIIFFISFLYYCIVRLSSGRVYIG